MSTTAPKGLKWTYEDYANLLEDGLRHEIIDRAHFVNPSPSTQHQTVSKRLQYQLYTKIELAGLGLLFSAPMDVQLSEFDIVQPDLVIILNENIRKITPTKIKVAPIWWSKSFRHQRRDMIGRSTKIYTSDPV